MTIDSKRAQAVFLAALEVTDSAACRALLDRQCGSDQALRARVEELLSADAATKGFDAAPSGSAAIATMEVREVVQPGLILAGRYKLIEPIGEGGMGSVWVAEQKEPVRRKVAIKLIKAGMDSKSVLARFEAERQALAMMDHPNIAKVFDGGMTDQGRPFFVMEYVKGVPLTDYCDQARLSLKERLQLFIPVCQAVQHAHQKGIIHRDLKPSNILICLYDGKPVPKVIDFGLAKAMHQSLTDQSLYTAHGMMVGTPLYMSPEQAEHNNLDVDTRTDIYSLGVILYELLTGGTPLERQHLKLAAYNEILRLIKEVEPPKPSTRLSGSASLPSIAAQRSIDPGHLKKLLTGELDWIVMKALDKERSRRYETANGFARDVERFLNDEAVEACPPTAGYRIRKLLRKHSAVINTAIAIAVVLSTATIVSGWMALRATKAEEKTRLSLQREIEQRSAAEDQRQIAEDSAKLANERLVQIEAEKARAEQERKVAQSVREFLQNNLLRQADLVTQADFLQKRGETADELQENPTVLELVDRAAAELSESRIEASFPNQPLLQCEILETVGETYLSLREHQKGVEFIERAVRLRTAVQGAEADETLKARQVLASAHITDDQRSVAKSTLEDILQIRIRVHGPEHRETLRTQYTLLVFDLPREPKEQEMRIQKIEALGKTMTRVLGAGDELTLMVRWLLANESFHTMGGASIKGISIMKEVVDGFSRLRGDTHPLTLDARSALASHYSSVGQIAEAIQTRKGIRDFCITRLGPDHFLTISAEHNLAIILMEWKGTAGEDLNLAVSMLEKAVSFDEKRLGPHSSRTLNDTNSLAMAYQRVGRTQEAVDLAKRASSGVLDTLGREHVYAWAFLDTLADAYRANGQTEECLKTWDEICLMTVEVYGDKDNRTMNSKRKAAVAYYLSGKFEKAIELLNSLCQTQTVVLGESNARTLTSLKQLSVVLEAAGKTKERLETEKAIITRSRAVLPAESLKLSDELARYGLALMDAREFEEAELVIREALKIRRAAHPAAHSDIATSLSDLALLQTRQNKLSQAEPLYREALDINRATLPAGHPSLLDVMSNLADLLAKQGKTEQALPLLKELLAEARAKHVKDSPELAGQLALIGRSMLGLKSWAEAEPLLRECLAIREKSQPDDWRTFNTKSMLGAALLGQKKYSEAEPLLREGHNGMRERETAIPPQGKEIIPDALNRLIELYTAWHADEPNQGYDLKAAEWQKKLDESTANSPTTSSAADKAEPQK